MRDRRDTEPGRRGQYPTCDEKRQSTGELSQSVYVLRQREKDGIQLILLSEIVAKDEFLNIKNVSRNDMMAVHRVQLQMMGIIPSNVGG